MDYIYIGTIINTHGIKGELRLLSGFDKKNLVFKDGFTIYIGEEKGKEVINSYRSHKHFDMITLKGLEDINEVLKYKEQKVYIKREDLNLAKNDYLLQDLIGMKIVNNKKEYGRVLDIYETKGNILLYIESDKAYYIPYVGEFIKNVDIKNKEIEVERIREFYEI